MKWIQHSYLQPILTDEHLNATARLLQAFQYPVSVFSCIAFFLFDLLVLHATLIHRPILQKKSKKNTRKPQMLRKNNRIP